MSKIKAIIKKIKRMSNERGFFNACIFVAGILIKRFIILLITKTTKVADKKVLFLNFSGNYDCNTKAICQKLIDEKVDADLVWGIYDYTEVDKNNFPKELRFTTRETYACVREMASAKVIVDNGVSLAWLGYTKKPSQTLIETWHGSIGIKKFGRDSNKDQNWLKLAEKEGQMTDYLVSNSDFEDAVYREDFWKTTEIWKYGHARNDILFCKDDKAKEIKNSVYNYFNIPKDAHLCMYAPTFRDDGDLSPYTIDYDKLSKALSNRFGGTWVILTRFHQKTKKFLQNYEFPLNVVDATYYIDIQELIVAIDAGITDYSSWICEYMLTRKPGFFFATDLNDYQAKDRSFFMPLSDYPFPVATNEEELLSNISNFNEEKFVNDCNEFLKANGSVDDGHASEKIVKNIKEILER